MKNIKNKKIIVTGGAGFIGSHTVNALVERGASVVIIDNLGVGRKENINPKAKFYKMNIADPKVKNVFIKEKPDVVYHFTFNALYQELDENALFDSDSIAGSINLFKNCQKYGVKKVIFASSGFLYGNTENLPTNEQGPIDPISSYVVAKNSVENYLRFFNKEFGLPYVIFRYGTAYGPGQVNGAMSDYINTLVGDQTANFWGDGSKTRDYIYIDDIVRANLLALDLPDSYRDPIFNVGTGVETSVYGLYKKIAKLLNKDAKPVFLPDRPGEIRRVCLDSSKVKRVLGWEAKINLDEGLKKRVT
ncbi:MAG: NAD-dependent epimerase/dehydratase family protein [Candidatus Staskawiczbacteria bacterium]|nr:NAD-dependent epimerase/dehydratase family protein [Candidatus Staskawiczbacteria bacterium]